MKIKTIDIVIASVLLGSLLLGFAAFGVEPENLTIRLNAIRAARRDVAKDIRIGALMHENGLLRDRELAVSEKAIQDQIDASTKTKPEKAE